jgi:hypothetical protein
MHNTHDAEPSKSAATISQLIFIHEALHHCLFACTARTGLRLTATMCAPLGVKPSMLEVMVGGKFEI